MTKPWFSMTNAIGMDFVSIWKIALCVTVIVSYF